MTDETETEIEGLRGEYYACLKMLRETQAELATLKERRCGTCHWFDAWPERAGTCRQVHTKGARMRVFSPMQMLVCEADFGGCAAWKRRQASQQEEAGR